jgi:hypothetical protein
MINSTTTTTTATIILQETTAMNPTSINANRELDLELDRCSSASVEMATEKVTASSLTMATTQNRRRPIPPLSPIAGWLLLALCLCASIRTAAGSDDASGNYYNDDGNNAYNQVDDKAFYYNGGQGNYNRYYDYSGDDANAKSSNNGYNYEEAYYNYHNGNYNSNDDANDNNNNYNGNANSNNANDDANGNDDANNANDDANNANKNNNDDGGKNYDYENYEAPSYDDAYDLQWMDDNIDIGVDGFDSVSIAPVSCVN